MVKSKNAVSELRMHMTCAQEVELKTVHKEVGKEVKQGEGMKIGSSPS